MTIEEQLSILNEKVNELQDQILRKEDRSNASAKLNNYESLIDETAARSRAIEERLNVLSDRVRELGRRLNA